MLEKARVNQQVFTLFGGNECVLVRIEPTGYVLVSLRLFDRWTNANAQDAMLHITNAGYKFDENVNLFTKDGVRAPSFKDIYVKRSEINPVRTVTVLSPSNSIFEDARKTREQKSTFTPSPVQNKALDKVVNTLSPCSVRDAKGRFISGKGLPLRGKNGRFLGKKTVLQFTYPEGGNGVYTSRAVVPNDKTSTQNVIRGYDLNRKGPRCFSRSKIAGRIAKSVQYVDFSS